MNNHKFQLFFLQNFCYIQSSHTFMNNRPLQWKSKKKAAKAACFSDFKIINII